MYFFGIHREVLKLPINYQFPSGGQSTIRNIMHVPCSKLVRNIVNVTFIIKYNKAVSDTNL
jgi:hypothetical protein